MTLIRAWNQCWALILESRDGLACSSKSSVAVLLYTCKLKQVIAQIQVRLCFPFPLESCLQDTKYLSAWAEKQNWRGFSDRSKKIHYLITTPVLLSLVRMRNFSFKFILNVKMAKVSMRTPCCYLVSSHWLALTQEMKHYSKLWNCTGQTWFFSHPHRRSSRRFITSEVEEKNQNHAKPFKLDFMINWDLIFLDNY